MGYMMPKIIVASKTQNPLFALKKTRSLISALVSSPRYQGCVKKYGQSFVVYPAPNPGGAVIWADLTTPPVSRLTFLMQQVPSDEKLKLSTLNQKISKREQVDDDNRGFYRTKSFSSRS
jgi:hypothetical protein